MSVALPLLPWPRELREVGGSFRLSSLRVDGAGARWGEMLIDRFAQRVALRFGTSLAVEYEAAQCNLQMVLAAGAADESYQLDVSSDGIEIRASERVGFLYALETLLQLVNADSDHLTVPCVQIRDFPRFRWRGLLLDPVRHWMPVSVVKQTLEGMAAVKLNVFHWHLTDDQAFRIECETFPRLHQEASRGEYYSVRDVADVIDFASALGIRVVPEFDVPGHATSWVAAYPALGCTDTAPVLQDRWGIFDTLLNPARESTYEFLDRFFSEMASRFPDESVHIGGDEVNGREWLESAEIREFMASIGAPSPGHLQRYFTARVRDIVRRHGKRATTWEEGAAPGVTVQTYKSADAISPEWTGGGEVIISFGFYLDLLRSAAEHYSVRMPAPICSESQATIIGGEACVWTELVTVENVTSRLWPRLGAIAERLWSSAEVVDEHSLDERLESLTLHLRSVRIDVGRDVRSMLARLSPPLLLESLEFVASFLEPVKDYVRHLSGAYNVSTPLTRLVDSIPPESIAARHFDELVSRGDANRIIEVLRRLEQQASALASGVSGTALDEILPLLDLLTDLAQIGCDLTAGADGATREELEELLSRSSEPIAELIVPFAKSVVRLALRPVDTHP